MQRWVVMNKKADFYKVAKTYGIDPVIARLIRNRNVVQEEDIRKYLSGNLEDLYSPHLMKDLDQAVRILAKKIREKKPIRIISDYDVDGVCSNYILFRGLEKCGAIVDYKIPDRIIDGYGINENLISQALEDGIDTILTCDNGIAAYDQIKFGKEQGLTMIVTDHHDVPFEEIQGEKQYIVPPADAVVNPKQADCSYPFSLLCGAVVALKLIIALYEEFHKPRDQWKEFLEFAAIATVCDVVSLTDENRILVKEGLKKMSHTTHTGLSALLSVTGLEGKKISSYHLGFIIGPCINASGRLRSAGMALELLLCEDNKKALSLAQDLKNLNEERKEMTMKGLEKAIALIEENHWQEDKVLTVYLPDCHESLAGIIAGRIREKYNRPVFVLTDSEEGYLKGSGRSIESYSMFEEMSRVKNLMTKFGGHPMAAGLTLPKENLSLFHEQLNSLSTLTEEDFVEKVTIDVAMPIQYIREDLIEQLSLLEPFGTENKKPLFAQKNLSILGARVLGAKRNVLKLKVSDADGFGMEGIYFGNIQEFNEYLTSHFGENEVEYMYQGRKNAIRLAVTYYPDVNEFRGQKTLQLIIQDYQ
ncbi:MAG: single-stranded-DNA-specific exonuclease RecJ [Lachnospiraceae bacterium]|nr:single-stranded-DNA-specific exonuclease RecJ [Lachnospiraceae bacterium]